ncbi:SDR family oxidoreductase [Streptomyces sp. NPDC015220]|uniref:SDR family oxidoreductase n=1 Tax=Streptomyces sp. NPDC015220 TaxID=3364947 RepID=UPI0036FC0789
MNGPRQDPPLSGRTFLVAGTAGGVGEAVARVLLGEGATVVVTDGGPEELARLAVYAVRTGAGRLVVEPVVVGDPDRAFVAALLTRYAPLDGAVLCPGDPAPPERPGFPGASGTRCEDRRDAVQWELAGHFHALLTLTALLSRSGALVYLSVPGTGEPPAFPGLPEAVSAAKSALVRSLAAGLEGAGPRVCELAVTSRTPSSPSPSPGPHGPGRPGLHDLARHAARVVARTAAHRAAAVGTDGPQDGFPPRELPVRRG